MKTVLVCFTLFAVATQAADTLPAFKALMDSHRADAAALEKKRAELDRATVARLAKLAGETTDPATLEKINLAKATLLGVNPIEDVLAAWNGPKSLEGVSINHAATLAARRSYAPPYRLTAEVKTTGDIRFSAGGASQIIFNWERDAGNLRVDGGPANGQHRKGLGRLPLQTFAEVEIEVTASTLTLTVDGKPRAEWAGNFAATSTVPTLFPGVAGSSILVRKFQIMPLP